MAPLRDPNRLFYDPSNPAMLTPDEVHQLSPAELQAATDQLDQHMVLLLQRTEEHFARANQIVTERILPAVQQHGENSARIFESIKFWRPFFEAAANIRLDQPYADDVSTVAPSEPGEASHDDEASHATLAANQTISDEGDVTYGAPSVGGTPRAPPASAPGGGEASTSGMPSEPHWSNDMSPFQSLQHDLHAPTSHSAAPAAARPAPASAHALPAAVERLRLRDLPPDSPDVPEPQFETDNFGGVLRSAAEVAASPTTGKGKSRALGAEGGESFDLSSAVPSEPSYTTPFPDVPPPAASASAARVPRAGGDKAHSALLEKLLRKNLASPARPAQHGPGSSTPGPAQGTARKLQFPRDVPRDWNGLADLSTNGLDAFPSPIKRRISAASSMADASFAQVPPSARSTAAYPPPSSSSDPLARSTTSTLGASHSRRPPTLASPAVSRTPAKAAAARTAQHVYSALPAFDLLDSPLLEPPSALRGPATGVYRFESTLQPSSRRAGGVGAEDAGEGEDGYEPASPSERGTARHAIRLYGASGAGDASYASSLPAQPSFAVASGTRNFDLAALGVEVAPPHRPLADFGGGTTANLDELLGGGGGHAPLRMDDYAGLVDDDEHDGMLQEGASYTATATATASGSGVHSGSGARDTTFTATHQYGGLDAHAQGHHGHGEYDDDDDDAFERHRRGLRMPGQDGPEDTLFGMPAARRQQARAGLPPVAAAKPAGGAAAGGRGVMFGGVEEYSAEGPYLEEDSFAEEARREGFKLHGLSEMETLHGGELLASEPFQASPLAGRSHQ
ncbi:hypothetical protein JCM10207_008009 [Rhodosporidiobolus poonsookiae]